MIFKMKSLNIIRVFTINLHIPWINEYCVRDIAISNWEWLKDLPFFLSLLAQIITKKRILDFGILYVLTYINFNEKTKFLVKKSLKKSLFL